MLGAGLDTFSLRNPYPDVRVFEVDFPATQAWKRERLRESGLAIPDTLTFAPVDFEREKFSPTDWRGPGFGVTGPPSSSGSVSRRI